MQERKYLAHYVDANFDTTYASTNYVRLGQDLEEYNIELNPDVEVSMNIIGEQSVKNSGYEVQGDVDPYYYENYDDALSEKIFEIANGRLTGDRCKTTAVDVLLQPDESDPDNGTPTVVWAYRQDCYIIPNSVGGDTSGIQMPFTIYYSGNRVKGTWDMSSKTFSETSKTSVKQTSAKASA